MVDLASTIAAVGGARTPEDWDGRSLEAQLDGPGARGRDMAVSQYYAHNIASGFAMLRAGEWKYVYHSAPDGRHSAQRELYNLREDPEEFRNLAGEAAQRSRVESLHGALLKELGEEPDETERRCRADFARGYGRQPRPGGKKSG
jgi:choline-sulfatase